MAFRSKAVIACLGVGLVLASAAWLASGRLDGPWGMVPGGRFRAESLPCGSVPWGRYTDSRELELEVRPLAPRSMTTWSVVHEGRLYVPADFLTPWKRWPQWVIEDPRVRLRIGGLVFACRAERVKDGATIERLRRTIAAKYDLDPDGRAVRVEVWWFRIGPR